MLFYSKSLEQAHNTNNNVVMTISFDANALLSAPHSGVHTRR